MLDDLRTYLQMASGLTEGTTAKARDAVTGLLAQGLSLTTRAMPAPETVGQVQALADDLMATSRSNREMLVGMIRAEVDRAVGRMGFVREDELAALRRHVQRLERQIGDLQAPTGTAGAPAPRETWPKGGSADDTPAAAAADAEAPRRKKKKVVVVDEGGHA